LELATADTVAEFPGGDQKLNSYIKDNWKWTEPADTINSFIYVSFMVRREGTITDIKIAKGNGCKSCYAEAVRLVRLMPKWIPARKKGVTVDQMHVLPILFQSSAIADRFAEFPGGRHKLDRYIKDHWKWIEPADTIDGFVFVSFRVRKDGTITDIEIAKGGCESCNTEAIRLVRLMPKWIPAQKNGVTIDQTYTLPILFESSAINK